MNEYLLLIRTEGDYCEEMTTEEHQQHLRRVSAYIQDLKEKGKLLSAQPLSMNGGMIEGKKGVIKDGPFTESKEVIIGYYHILASSLSEATDIAAANPVLHDATAQIEIREIKKEKGIN